MQNTVVQAAALHDVGNIAVPKDILKKLGPLDGKEHHTLMRHADVGAAILSNLGINEGIVEAIRHHHEWWNGQGISRWSAGRRNPHHCSNPGGSQCL